MPSIPLRIGASIESTFEVPVPDGELVSWQPQANSLSAIRRFRVEAEVDARKQNDSKLDSLRNRNKYLMLSGGFRSCGGTPQAGILCPREQKEDDG